MQINHTIVEEGDKAKITLRFRGREMAHQEFGMRLLERVKGDLDEVAVVEQFPKMEGRQLVMVLSPKKKVVPVKGASTKVSPQAGVKPAAAKPAASPDVAKPVVTPGQVVVAESATAQNAVTEEKK